MKGYAKKYKCVNCGKVINAMYCYTCPYCNYEQPLDKRAESLGDKVVDIKCDKCGFAKSFYRSDPYMDTAYCAKCGRATYKNTEGKESLIIDTPQPTVECPYCHSKDTKKISGISKVGSIAMFGLFAIGKATKQWHCNNCKSDF